MSEHTSTLGDDVAGPSTLGWVVAGLSTGAAVIHFAMVPGHIGDSLLDPLGFAVAGWFQLWVAGAALTGRAGRRTWIASVLGNLAITAAWVWSRTVGLPVGNHEGIVEEVGAIDLAAQVLGMGAALLSARLVLAPTGGPSRARLAPAFAAAAAIGLATTVITSQDAATHGHADEAAPALTGHAAQMAQIDADRCDTAFNHPSYWAEAEELGIDTYLGGSMAMTDEAATTSADGHAHGATAAASATTTTTRPDPNEGRGSEGLDKLIGLTGPAGSSEGAAARLVISLGEASDEDYDAWLWWLRASGAVGGGHGHDSAAPGDSGGHGGHVGPQPWVAMTDQAQCDRLAEELDLVRSITEKYDTVAKAEAGGWTKVTGYVPGIAAHYMNFGAVDTRFDIEVPEMILFDGTDPDSAVVGLSYYIIHDGDAEPSQGFTGPNDHFHRHVGLCIVNGVVAGDSQTTAEECEARGGSKAGGDDQWMNHVWVVPGCESPWGLFSAASPVLDGALGRASAADGGGCAGSGVRDRYGLDDPAPTAPGGTDGDETAGTASGGAGG
jgi:hypothetical protein